MAGMIRHGAELAFAYAEATVPRICVILRKAFGAPTSSWTQKGMGNDACLAWRAPKWQSWERKGQCNPPSARLARGPQAAPRCLRSDLLTPWPAAERGFVDAVIDPSETRRVVAMTLDALLSKKEELPGRKHDGGPL